jgi:hypothetical protein
MGPVEFTRDNIIEESFPIGLGDDFDLKSFVSKKPFSFAITMGAQSVSLMKPNLSESFSRSSSPPPSAGTGAGSEGGVVDVVAGVGVSVDGEGSADVFSSALSLHEHASSAVIERRMVLRIILVSPVAGSCD